MASYQIPPPAPMSMKGDLASNWKNFQTAWEYYSIATELKVKPDDVQAATLCSVMGIDCIKVMDCLKMLTVPERGKPGEILGRLREHFMPKKHLLFERRKFGQATHGENESIDCYHVRLRQLAESCEYEELCDGLIRDRLLMGTTDQRTSDKLLNERPVPDLNRCVEVLRAAELTRAHKETLRLGTVNEESEAHSSRRQTYA
ncbi:Uncharacterised protein g7662 [Pycnogonum litorale]